MSDRVRVRFAPSPTGHLHIGSARTALFNYLLARKTDGSFIIRIEDTDQARNVENGEEKLLKGLKWLGINWDESVDVGGNYGPYRSMDRLDTYHEHIDLLKERGQAYPCYCTSAEIEAERESQLERGETPRYSGKCRYLTPEQKEQFVKEGRKPSIRFHVPEGEIFKVDDTIRGEVEFESDGVGDFVIARPDGIPTYNFAVTIDDNLMEISHVIRGEEHLSNTPRQLAIYQAFNWKAPKFAHIPLILNPDRKKMSKRDESIIQFVEQYNDLGFLPDAILNFVALLGWSPEGEEEIFTKEQLISQFSLERVSKSPAVFDIQKLFWMNNHYIKTASLETVVGLCLPHLQKEGLVPETLNEEQQAWVNTLVGLYQEQLNYGQEIVELTKLFFEDQISFDDEGQSILAEEFIPVVMEEFKNQITLLTEFTPQGIKDALKAVQKNTGYKGKQLFMPVRVAVTGATHGRDLPETLFLLGKEKVLKRLDNILTRQG